MKFYTTIIMAALLLCWSILFPLGVRASPIVFNVSDLPESFPSQTNPLWNYQDQEVQVRGFWYPLTSEQGILAPTPNLKSCCIGTPKKVSRQLVVKGNLPSSYDNQAIAITGVFKIEPLYDSKGELTQLYVLEKPQREEKKPMPLSTILLIGGLGMTIFYFSKKSKQS